MTVILDGKTVVCKQLNEDCKAVAIQWDAWLSSAYKRKIKTYGLIRVWTLKCVESGVLWASSQVKSFEDSELAGSVLALSVDDEVRAISTNVYVLGVSIDAVDLGGKNLRYFTLTLQEA